MLNYISTLEALYKECENMQKDLEVEVSDDLNELVERGNLIIVYMARSGKMLSDAKYLQSQAVNKSIINILKINGNLSPSIAKQLIDSSTVNENFLVDWCDRINRSCTHQLDWLRTVISKNKEEMRMNNFLQ